MIKFSQVLDRLSDKLEMHAKLINTFSLLEYIGSRKIVKSQVDREITVEILNHIAEEVRHSLVLKNLALKLSSGVVTSYSDMHLLAGSAGKAYMQTVDWAVKRLLDQTSDLAVSRSTAGNQPYSAESSASAWKNYLVTTLLIEERAAEIYPAYDAYLAKLGYPNKLGSIIRDEDKHLESVSGHLFEDGEMLSQSCLVELRAIESQAFEKFMDSVLDSLRQL